MERFHKDFEPYLSQAVRKLCLSDSDHQIWQQRCPRISILNYDHHHWINVDCLSILGRLFPDLKQKNTSQEESCSKISEPLSRLENRFRCSATHPDVLFVQKSSLCDVCDHPISDAIPPSSTSRVYQFVVHNIHREGQTSSNQKKLPDRNVQRVRHNAHMLPLVRFHLMGRINQRRRSILIQLWNLFHSYSG